MVAGHAPLDKGFAKSVFDKVICAFQPIIEERQRRGEALDLMRPIGCVLHHITELYETVRSLDGIRLDSLSTVPRNKMRTHRESAALP
jgi:hypothetical protein